LHALSRAASPARAVRVARSLRSLASRLPVFISSPLSSEGRRPSDSPARSLARRFAGARRSRGSLAALARFASSGLHFFTSLIRGASPLGLPCTLSRAPLRRRAPFAWLARCARSLRVFRSSFLHLSHPL